MPRIHRHRKRGGGVRRAASYLYSKFTMAQIAEAMELAGTDPAMIYAFRKTEIMPCEDTIGLFSPEQLAAWDAAIAEYDELHGVAAKGAGA